MRSTAMSVKKAAHPLKVTVPKSEHSVPRGVMVPARHDGESYEVHLCESCFFQALASLQEQRRGQLMFSDQGYEPNPDFGRIESNKEII